MIIIMAISVMFSAIIYRQTIDQFRANFLPRQRFIQRIDPRFAPLYTTDISALFAERYEEVAAAIRARLILLNALVFGFASVASYFLAKRTLRPIEVALDDQRRFTADASHELRTPLAAMKAEIEVALKTNDSGEHKRVLGSTLEEVAKLEHLSSSLLHLARHEQEQHEPLTEEVQFTSVAEQALRRVEPVARRKGITIERHGDDATIIGDPLRLVDLLVIILDNAIKYSPERGEIRFTTIASKKLLTITVTDDGVGIPATDLPHVFRRFYRADVSRSKNSANGYGLGLAIAKHIVERHHGTIVITSEEGKGTSVIITLPSASIQETSAH
ncbi:MAG: ATP-binding protein [Ilumatobacteraceae bacterium]